MIDFQNLMKASENPSNFHDIYFSFTKFTLSHVLIFIHKTHCTPLKTTQKIN